MCTEVVHSHKHTWMSSSYSSLAGVLSYWVHFTEHRIHLCLRVCILCSFHTASMSHVGVELMGLKPSP